MNGYSKITPESWQANPFKVIGKDWMLVTAKKGEDINTMTASWGGMGVMWGKPVAFVVIRPQRYTREFVDQADTFSLSFFDESYRKQLSLCGSKSGRDINKIEQCKFTVAYDGDTPYFSQADTVITCRKLYRQPLEPGGFLDKTLNMLHYPGNDHHILYVSEIEQILIRE